MSIRHTVGANRRQFLQGSAALTGSGALLASGAAASASLLTGPRASVVLHDPRLQVDANLMADLKSGGATFIELTTDPVRLWRGAQRDLLANQDTRLFGITRWPDFLIVRGLAAESRRYVRHESMESATGVMTWLIA